jgi:hypothetical protein
MPYVPAVTFENAKEKRIDANRVERHFCKCYACKEATTVDFEVIVWSFPWFNKNVQRTVWEPRVEYYRLDGENKVSVNNPYIAECPRCNAPKPKNTRLKSKRLVIGHECNDKCQKATCETCNCSCDGKGHGIKNRLHEGICLF